MDVVGVPLLLSAGYYPSAALYLVYGVVVAYGFVVWWRAQRVGPPREVVPAAERATAGTGRPSTLG